MNFRLATVCLAWLTVATTTGAATNHWAFEPVRKVSPPKVRNKAWPQTPVDRFVLAKLEANQLKPAPPADRLTLIRRATFDLLGLPPTPEEVEAFVRNPAPTPKAFATLVDRLLESPRYGERWGRHWLDVARYADNKGYVFFEEKTYPWAWTYRDYVVQAFNDDKPFDQFVREQLAADQLNAATERRASPGPMFQRHSKPGDARRSDRDALPALGFLTVGDHFSNNTHDILDDRIDVVTRGLLGLTVACARCHDHKFDPVKMADYYALYGVFRSSTEPMVPPLAAAPALTERYEEFELVLMEKQRRLREFVEGRHREILHGGRTRVAEYLMAVYAQRNQPATESFMLLADKGDVNPAVVSRWRTHLERAGGTNAIWAPWLAFAALEETNFTAGATQVYDRLLAEARLNYMVREKVVLPGVPKTMKELAERYGTMFASLIPEGSAATNHDAHELRHILYGPDAPPNVPAEMDWGFLSLLPDRASQGEFQKLITDLEQWLMRGPEAPPRAMVLEDLPVPFEPRLFARGNPNRPTTPVPRRFISLLDRKETPFRHGSGRRELANAIADPKNPLTARVFVNRVWHQHFGAGLVTTPSDFGLRGEPPSHPELLDWLAGEFVRGGWSVNRLHRLIMGSAVYQQSSVISESVNSDSVAKRPAHAGPTDLLITDSSNRLLSRFPRRRHDFETQRDALLAVSGKLDAKAGGPPAPLGSNRRSLYVFVDRLDVPPLMTTFDFPSPSASCPQRPQTTVSPQALYLMNNEFVMDCAAAVLTRADVTAANSSEEKVVRLHALLFARAPHEAEQRRAARFLGPAPDEKAWRHYVHALMLANEFVFVD